MSDKPSLKDVGKNRDWITREKIEKIIDRYSYDVMDHLRSIRHMGCYYGQNGRQICTCGLLTDLMRLDCVIAEQLYPDFLEEAGNHQRSFNLMMPA
jgi:hypothetical protein